MGKLILIGMVCPMPFEGETKKLYNKKYQKRLKESKIDGEKAREDFEKCATLDLEGKIAVGEVETYTDLCKIYYGRPIHNEGDSDYIKETKKVIQVAGKTIFKEECDFWKWLELRSAYYKDFWRFMHTRGSWNPVGHKMLAEFFGDKDNSMLKPGYTEDDFKEFVLNAVDGPTNYLLCFPRAFRKSTVNILDCAHWIVNSHGDIVILVVSSTRRLGFKFVRLLRAIFEVKNYDNPTDFQKLFPEHCIAEGDGDSKKFISPCRRLGLKDPTLEFSSMESGGFAGSRAHLIKFDDAVDEKNWQTVDSRLKIVEKFDAAGELIEAPYGRIYVIGTRWTNGRPDDFVTEDGEMRVIPDLYGEILNREEQAQVKSWKILIKAAWEPREHAIGKDLLDLTEDDVDLLCPGKGVGSYAVLRDKLEKSSRQARPFEQFECQQLNRPAMRMVSNVFPNPFEEGNGLIVSCQTHSSHILPKVDNKVGRIFAFWDYANSTRPNADFSAGAVLFIEDFFDKDPIAWLLEIVYGRWPNSELAKRIVALHKKWDLNATFIEQLVTTSDTFKKEIYTQQLQQDAGRWDPQWFDPDKQPKAKEQRIVDLEPLMKSGRFKICSQGERTNAVNWIDELKKEFFQYTGHKSNKNYVGGRHDDLIDAISYVYKVMPMANRTDADRLIEERLAAKRERDKMYSMVFDGVPGSHPLNHGYDPVDEPVSNPLYRALEPLNNLRKPASGIPMSFPRRQSNN